MHLNPLHHFEIKKIIDISLFGIDISLTNSAIAMLIISISSSLLLAIAVRIKKEGSLISRPHAFVEMLFNAMYKLTEEAIGHKLDKKTIKQANFVFCMFMFLLCMNYSGMIPQTFAPTAQFAVTFAAGIVVTLVTLSISIKKHGIKFLFKILIPEGTPIFLAPLIFVLELFSYFARPISLCVRLGANIIAGHVMLEVMAFLTAISGAIFIFPLLLTIAINLMEFGVVALQAYIFALLAATYIGEANHH